MEKQDLALALVAQGKNVFITGYAGTGKSTLLRKLKKERPDSIVVAPTGLAAINVGGLTVHSLFMLNPSVIEPEDLDGIHGWRLDAIHMADMLILDEISMVRVDLLNLIDFRLKQIMHNESPFGGKQVVMFGDMCQLPPVVPEGDIKDYLYDVYGGPYFFQHPVIRAGNFYCVELDKIYRQSDPVFIGILNSIRNGEGLDGALKLLEDRVMPGSPEDVYLTATNYDADKVNEQHLVDLPGDFVACRARVAGTFPESMYPTEVSLFLKPGARVMNIYNDQENGLVNGSLGTVLEASPEEVIICADGRPDSRLRIRRHDWINYKLTRSKKGSTKFKMSVEPVGTFSQIPLRLAWAMTIHKSQGQTFDRVHVNMGRGAFAHGQTYVALSRCRTLEGLTLSKNIQASDIQVDPLVLTYKDYFEEATDA